MRRLWQRRGRHDDQGPRAMLAERSLKLGVCEVYTFPNGEPRGILTTFVRAPFKIS